MILLGCLLAFGLAVAPRAFLILAWIFSERWPVVWGATSCCRCWASPSYPIPRSCTCSSGLRPGSRAGTGCGSRWGSSWTSVIGPRRPPTASRSPATPVRNRRSRLRTSAADRFGATCSRSNARSWGLRPRDGTASASCDAGAPGCPVRRRPGLRSSGALVPAAG